MQRRQFLQALAHGLFALPVMGMSRRVHAAGDQAKRLVVFFTPNGTIPSAWRPAGSGADFTFPIGSILEPLQPIRSKLVVVDGLNFIGATNHEGGMRHMLTGGSGGVTQGMSVDQYVAQELGAATRLKALTLGVQTSAWGGSVQTRMSYGAGGKRVAPNDDPVHVYRQLFGDAGPPAQVDAVFARRKSIIDLLRAELDDLGRRAGDAQKKKVDAHLQALREMETNLQGSLQPPPASGTCSPPAGGPFTLDTQNNDNFPAVGRAQTDLMVAALACDITRVASLQWSHTVSPTVATWLNQNEGHHSLSHMGDDTPGAAAFVTFERWYAEQFRYLVDRLDALPEPGGVGSMLDNTVVLWSKEMGDSRLHVCESVPFVLAGGGGGAFSLGRSLRYAGESHAKLLVSVCQAVGLTNTTFGDPTHGTGALPGLRA